MTIDREWWCELRRAWCRWDGEGVVVVETEHEIAARRGSMPSTIGRWIVEAFKALGVHP